MVKDTAFNKNSNGDAAVVDRAFIWEKFRSWYIVRDLYIAHIIFE
jgi:hypothetical protein